MSETIKVTIPFSPRPWQQKIFNSLKKTNVIVVHRGAGKSILAANILIKAAITGPSNADYAFVLPYGNQAHRNIWKPLRHFSANIPKMHYNNATKVVTFPNGARIFVLGADDPDSLRGLHLHGVVLDEFADMKANTMTSIDPMLSNHNGWIYMSGTPRGKNQFYDYWIKAQDPIYQKAGWFGTLLTWEDTGALSQQAVDRMRLSMPESMFEQELCCSFTAAFVGSYWGKEIAKLRADGRVQPDLYRHDTQVSTSWDLGISDSMSVWFFQLVGQDIHLIDYEEQAGWSFQEWKTLLDNRARRYGYRYQTHWGPHDLAVRELTTGVSRLDTAKKIGINFTRVPPHRVEDGIQSVRLALPRCRFDEVRCSEGIEHLMSYQARLDKLGEDVGPLHNSHSHAADSFRYLISGVDSIKGVKPSMYYFPFMRR